MSRIALDEFRWAELDEKYEICRVFVSPTSANDADEKITPRRIITPVVAVGTEELKSWFVLPHQARLELCEQTSNGQNRLSLYFDFDTPIEEGRWVGTSNKDVPKIIRVSYVSLLNIKETFYLQVISGNSRQGQAFFRAKQITPRVALS